ncbi:hypothetical protein JCM5350_004767 [Sporobolomyces pararoseus]
MLRLRKTSPTKGAKKFSDYKIPKSFAGRSIEAALVTIQDPHTTGRPSARYSEVEYSEIRDYLANFSRGRDQATSFFGSITVIEDPRQVGSVVHNFKNREDNSLPHHNLLSGLKLSPLMLSFFFNELGFKFFFQSKGWDSSQSHHRYHKPDYTIEDYVVWKRESGYGLLRQSLLRALTDKWLTISSEVQYKLFSELLVIEDHLLSSMSNPLDGYSSISEVWRIFESASRNNAPLLRDGGRTYHLEELSNILTSHFNSYPPFPHRPSNSPANSHERRTFNTANHSVSASLTHSLMQVTARQRSRYLDV